MPRVHCRRRCRCCGRVCGVLLNWRGRGRACKCVRARAAARCRGQVAADVAKAVAARERREQWRLSLVERAKVAAGER